jgi:hypothetical protein
VHTILKFTELSRIIAEGGSLKQLCADLAGVGIAFNFNIMISPGIFHDELKARFMDMTLTSHVFVTNKFSTMSAAT